ncbi:MAG: hypothetical protein ACRD5I_01650 [Candidatus Acidiferrales bacterium]
MGYHYDPEQALEELNEEVLLPTPVQVRDLVFRAKLPAEQALEVDRDFEAYLKLHGDLQQLARRILEQLAPPSTGQAARSAQR